MGDGTTTHAGLDDCCRKSTKKAAGGRGKGGGFLSGTLYSRLPSGGPAVLGGIGTLTDGDGLCTHGLKAGIAQ
jgi:hypothetical protein